MEYIVHLLFTFKYSILFPLAIVEGPVLAIIAGFLCTKNFLNPFIVFPLIILGDVTGDTFCYLLGRWGTPKFIKKIGKRLGLNPKNIERARILFNSNPIRTISLSKITLGIGVAGIYLAGNARVPYRKFFIICVVTSSFQYSIYLGIGLLFGDAYIQISRYLDYTASFIIAAVIGIILFISIKTMLKNL